MTCKHVKSCHSYLHWPIVRPIIVASPTMDNPAKEASWSMSDESVITCPSCCFLLSFCSCNAIRMEVKSKDFVSRRDWPQAAGTDVCQCPHQCYQGTMCASGSLQPGWFHLSCTVSLTYVQMTALQHALDDFHHLKDIFIELECWGHFNIPKFHSLIHYADTIWKLGSLEVLFTCSLHWCNMKSRYPWWTQHWDLKVTSYQLCQKSLCSNEPKGLYYANDQMAAAARGGHLVQ